MRPKRRSQRASVGFRHGTAASSGRALSACNWATQNHHVRFTRKLTDMGRLARPLGDRADVAERLLLAELLHRGREGGVVLRRPLGERGVPGPVHANESCHEASIRLVFSGSEAAWLPPEELAPTVTE